METMEQKEYRGFTINIHVDDDPQNPRTDFDNAGKMVCFHTRYNLGDEQAKDPQEWLKDLACELDSTLADRIEYWESRQGWTQLANKYHGQKDKHGFPVACDKSDELIQSMIHKTIEKHCVMLPLYLYDHSGITMNTSGFGCPWDSGQVGYIYITNADAVKEWGKKVMTKAVRQKAVDCLKAEVENYDQYLTGDVYGYTIDPTDRNKSISCNDSCWGFYGREGMEQMIDEAKAAIDECIKEYREKTVAEVMREREYKATMYEQETAGVLEVTA